MPINETLLDTPFAQYLARYVYGVAATLDRLVFRNKDQRTDTIAQFTQNGIIESHPMPGDRRRLVYSLTRPAADRLGCTYRKKHSPANVAALLGVACYAAMHAPERRILTGAELQNYFPELYDADLCRSKVRYFIEQSRDGAPYRLGHLEVDVLAQPKTIVTRSRNFIQKRCERLGSLRELVDHRGLAVAVLAATEEKLDDLRKAKRADAIKNPLWRDVEFQPVADSAFSELLPCIMGASNA